MLFIPKTIESSFDRTCNFGCSYCNGLVTQQHGVRILISSALIKNLNQYQKRKRIKTMENGQMLMESIMNKIHMFKHF